MPGTPWISFVFELQAILREARSVQQNLVCASEIRRITVAFMHHSSSDRGITLCDSSTMRTCGIVNRVHLGQGKGISHWKNAVHPC